MELLAATGTLESNRVCRHSDGKKKGKQRRRRRRKQQPRSRLFAPPPPPLQLSTHLLSVFGAGAGDDTGDGASCCGFVRVLELGERKKMRGREGRERELASRKRKNSRGSHLFFSLSLSLVSSTVSTYQHRCGWSPRGRARGAWRQGPWRLEEKLGEEEEARGEKGKEET